MNFLVSHVMPQAVWLSWSMYLCLQNIWVQPTNEILFPHPFTLCPHVAVVTIYHLDVKSLLLFLRRGNRERAYVHCQRICKACIYARKLTQYQKTWLLSHLVFNNFLDDLIYLLQYNDSKLQVSNTKRAPSCTRVSRPIYCFHALFLSFFQVKSKQNFDFWTWYSCFRASRYNIRKWPTRYNSVG